MPDFKGARQGSRIERGYGRGHVAMRRALLARHHPADPCCLCGRPLGPAGRSIHLDHCPTCRGAGCPACKGAGYRGLSHARCNVVDGARRGQQRSRATRLQW